MANKLQPKEQKHKFSVMLTTPDYQKLIKNTLKDPQRANNFIANISTVVANNPMLQDCEAATILSAAFLAESLKLSMSPTLGYCYLVPYETAVKGPDGKTVWLFNADGTHQLDENGRWKKKTVKKAQFQMGYKGYIQLAQRSGQYKKLNVLPIKEGELISFNPLEEEIVVNLIEDELERERAETIGYYAMFEYHTGFRKAIYWSKRKMMAHADKYSKAFSADTYEQIQAGTIPEKDMWKYSSFWYKDFDAMAMKTMLRQIISKWGTVSIEMEDILKKDMAVIESSDKISYVDTDDDSHIIAQPDPVSDISILGDFDDEYNEGDFDDIYDEDSEQPPNEEDTEELNFDEV